MRASTAARAIVATFAILGVSSGARAEPKPAPSPRCADPCLFLTDTALAGVGDAYRATCSAPTPDLAFTDCTQLDILRKCVYAAHGYVFKHKRWAAVYGKKSWYVAHPEYRPTQVSAIELANIRELDARARACKRGVAVSTADAARATAWAVAYTAGAPSFPPIVLVETQPASQRAFLDYLARELAYHNVPIRVGSNSTVSYDDTPNDDLLAAARAPAGAKLRVVVIDRGDTNTFDPTNPITEGVQLRLVYDNHDALLAINVAHYLWD